MHAYTAAGDIFDPLKRDWIKARNERLNMGVSAGTSSSEKLGKDTFDTKVRVGASMNQAKDTNCWH